MRTKRRRSSGSARSRLIQSKAVEPHRRAAAGRFGRPAMINPIPDRESALEALEAARRGAIGGARIEFMGIMRVRRRRGDQDGDLGADQLLARGRCGRLRPAERQTTQ